MIHDTSWMAILIFLFFAGTVLAIASGVMTRLPFSLRKVLFGKG